MTGLTIQNYSANASNLTHYRVEETAAHAFHSSIPVVDISKFDHPATQNEFLGSLEKGLQVGFFAVVNPDIDIKTIKDGYDAFAQFFASPQAAKNSIHHPELHGQRGYVPSETALNTKSADSKEFVHIGSSNNFWPNHMDLEGPALRLRDKLKEMGQPLLRAIALLLGEREDFLTNMTQQGENLMRALHYYKNPKDGIWAAEHTDIDLLTILPYASEKGLQVEINGQWVPIYVPENALIVNVGDMLEAYSNGRWPSCKHRVMSTTPDSDRESIVYFIHPTSETVIRPLGKEPPRYPIGTRLEYVMLRLFSLKLLSKEGAQGVITGDFIKRIKTMVDGNVAADSVKQWFKGFQSSLAISTSPEDSNQ